MATKLSKSEKAKLALRILSRMNEDPLKHWSTFIDGKKPRRMQYEPELQHRQRLCNIVKEACIDHLAAGLDFNEGI